jgi:hypothetical protein
VQAGDEPFDHEAGAQVQPGDATEDGGIEILHSL